MRIGFSLQRNYICLRVRAGLHVESVLHKVCLARRLRNGKESACSAGIHYLEKELLWESTEEVGVLHEKRGRNLTRE